MISYDKYDAILGRIKSFDITNPVHPITFISVPEYEEALKCSCETSRGTRGDGKFKRTNQKHWYDIIKIFEILFGLKKNISIPEITCVA